MDLEEWRVTPYSTLHEVSSWGRVRSNTAHSKGRFLKPYPVYYRAKSRPPRIVKMTVALARKNVHSVHKLVLEAFVGPRPEGMEGCHNDGNAANNRLDNLRWGTHFDNMQDAKLHGTHFTPFNTRGEGHHTSKLTEDAVREIRAAPARRGVKSALARKYGVSPTQILRVQRGIGWEHIAP